MSSLLTVSKLKMEKAFLQMLHRVKNTKENEIKSDFTFMVIQGCVSICCNSFEILFSLFYFLLFIHSKSTIFSMNC